jgi:hypothetical protein
VLLIGGLGVVLLIGALALHLAELALWALLVLTGAYCLGIPVHVSTAAQATGYGLGLLGVAELSYLSLDQITWVRGEAGTQRRRLGLLLLVVAGTLAVDRVAIGSAGLAVGDNLLLAAAVAGLLLIVGTVVMAVLAASGSADGAGADRGADAVRRAGGERAEG